MFTVIENRLCEFLDSLLTYYYEHDHVLPIFIDIIFFHSQTIAKIFVGFKFPGFVYLGVP